MWFYHLFISLTCEKACEINLQADIFVSILILCQRFIQSTASWDGPLQNLIPAPRQTDAAEGSAKGCLQCPAHFPIPSSQPLPADAAEDSAMKPGKDNRDPKSKMCTTGFCHCTSHRSYISPGREWLKFPWMTSFIFDARPISSLWRVSLKPAWNGTKIQNYFCLFKRKGSFFRLQHRPGEKAMDSYIRHALSLYICISQEQQAAYL